MLAKNEVIVILSSLNSSEWLWLHKFLASPYHNSDQRLIPLGKYYQSVTPPFKWNEKEAYAQCFPDSPFDARKWGDLLRKLLAVLHDFIIQQQLKTSPANNALLAIDGRMQRKLYGLIQKKIDQYELAVTQQTLLPWEAANAYRVRWQKQYELPGTSPAMKEIDQANDYNRLLYCLLELRYRIEWQIVDINAYKKTPLQEKALLELAETLSQQHPVLGLYINSYQALRENPPPPDLLHRCEQDYRHLYPQLHPRERLYFFTKLFSLFNRNTHAQRPNALEDFFRFISFAIDQQLFLNNVKMTERTFLNICFVGLGVNAVEWVEAFRANHLTELDTPNNENAALLSSAFLAYARGNYEQVYLLSSKAKRLPTGHRQQLYGIQIKALTERYLLDEITAPQLRDYLRAADRFARYHTQVRSSFKAPFLALIKILRKLIIMREGRKPSSLIKAHLNNMKQEAPKIIASEWLQEKIDQL